MLGEENEAVTVGLLESWVLVLPEKCVHHLGQEEFAALIVATLSCWSSSNCLVLMVLLGHQSQDRFSSLKHDLVSVFVCDRECLLQASDQHNLSSAVALIALLFHVDGEEIECSDLEVSDSLRILLLVLWTLSFDELLG